LYTGANPALAAELTPPRERLLDDAPPPDTALQLVRDELMLDGNVRLNLATFVTTWMEPQARELMAEFVDKNVIDKDEYPHTAELERRCVAILADLWNRTTSWVPPPRARPRYACSRAWPLSVAGPSSGAPASPTS
jgi:glutamate decarboxylase